QKKFTILPYSPLFRSARADGIASHVEAGCPHRSFRTPRSRYTGRRDSRRDERMKIVHCPVPVRERHGFAVVYPLTWQMFATDDMLNARMVSDVWDVLEVVEMYPTRHDHAVIITKLGLDPATTTCLSVGRGLDPHAEAFRQRFGFAFAEGPETFPAPCDVFLLDRGRLWHTQPMERWHGDMLSLVARRTLQAPTVSRASVKWLQTLPLLRYLGFDIDRIEHWLELGAAPGGMTRVLADTACVTAVDLAPLAPEVAALPGVTAVAADVTRWEP